MTFSRPLLAPFIWLALIAAVDAVAAVDVVAAEPLIDSSLAEVQRQASVSPTPVCDDATFLRRASLDLIGRVPTVLELSEFRKRPDREAAVDQLLADPEHVRFWSQLWTTMLIGRAEGERVESEVLRSWLQEQLANNKPIDQMAFDLIAAQGVTSLDGPANFIVANRDDPVMRLSRTFLSVQLDCAECHDHPHDRWTNGDYLAMKRFFQPLSLREVSGGIAVADLGPADDQEVPVFLTGRKPQTAAWRRELAWMVVQSKPFSRAMVNRVWYWLMGRGLVDPVDGWTRDNRGAAPQLLEKLASDLRGERFDLRQLIRRICLSDAYQRDSKLVASADSDLLQSRFAVRTIRPMLPEQWLLSVAQVLDRPLPSPVLLADQSRKLLGLTRASVSEVDPFQWSASTQTLIRQLSGDVPAPLRDLDEVYLATLARLPTDREKERAVEHSSRSLLFALVHCNEFMMND